MSIYRDLVNKQSRKEHKPKQINHQEIIKIQEITSVSLFSTSTHPLSKAFVTQIYSTKGLFQITFSYNFDNFHKIIITTHHCSLFENNFLKRFERVIVDLSLY